MLEIRGSSQKEMYREIRLRLQRQAAPGPNNVIAMIPVTRETAGQPANGGRGQHWVNQMLGCAGEMYVRLRGTASLRRRLRASGIYAGGMEVREGKRVDSQRSTAKSRERRTTVSWRAGDRKNAGWKPALPQEDGIHGGSKEEVEEVREELTVGSRENEGIAIAAQRPQRLVTDRVEANRRPTGWG
jgi:hypothetical protein